MNKQNSLLKTLLVALWLLVGVNYVWGDPVETVGTDGTGDSWENRKYSSFYNIAQGETFHWNFTLTTYDDGNGTKSNWHNWLLNVKATAGTATDDWFFTLRADNYGWGGCYNDVDNKSNYNWSTFQADQNGATVDMYVNYSEEDQKVRTYVHTTTSDGTKTYFYYNTSSAITESPASVYIALCEQYANLVINTAEKVTASMPSTVYLYSRTGGAATTYTNAWAASDISATEWTGNSGTLELTTTEPLGLKYTSPDNGGGMFTKSITTKSNSKIIVNATWYVGSSTGRAGNHNILQLGSLQFRAYGQDQYGGLYDVSGTDAVEIKRFGGKDDVRPATTGAWVITLTIDKSNGKITYNVDLPNSADVTGEATLSSVSFSNVGIGFTRGGRTTTSNSTLGKIEIIEKEQDVTNANYTINYQLNGTTVKTVTGTSVVGETITAVTAIDGTEEGYVGVHYLSTSEDASTMDLVADAASNVLNVPVRAPYTATYRLTKNINGSSSYVDYPFTETDERVCAYAVGCPMYEKDGDDYYLLTGETNYADMGSFTDGQMIEKTVNYTTAADDVVWFKDINGGSVNSTSYSGGSYADTSEQLANVTVDAGVYDVIFYVVSKSGSGSNHRNEGVSVNGTNVANLTGNVNGIRTLRIIVEDDNSIVTAYGNGASNYTDNLDYVIIRKIMDGTTVSVTVGANGYTTFASPFALDLTDENRPEGLKAYKATLTGKTLSFAELNQTVAAGTGLLLLGETEGGTYNIPVVATGDAVETALTGVITPTAKQSSDAGDYYFVMKKAKTAEDALTFAPLSTTQEVTIPAGKAYVTVPSSAFGGSESRSLGISFDEITGIAEVNGRLDNVRGEIYNLKGQRVAQPAKGLYIMNGKKVIIK